MDIQQRYTQRTAYELTELIAARQSMPAGGSATALAGALAAALAQMVVRYTQGKAAYEAWADDLEGMLLDLEQARKTLLALVDEDAQAFRVLEEAFALEREDPARPAALERGYKAALVAPSAMMEETAVVIEVCEQLERKGTRMLRSDVACAVALARAALEAAAANVVVNTALIADRAYASSVDAEAERLLETWRPRAQACYERMIAAIRAHSVGASV